MANYYLAVDIGASSGRHILAHMEAGKLVLEEVHRFPNGMNKKDGELCWDLEALFQEIKAGLAKCKALGKIPKSVGVDTWGVDFVLLDGEDRLLGNTVGYRDERTQGMDVEVFARIPEEELYSATGIQKAPYNTIYQLMAVKKNHPEHLEAAKTFLMVPDYFHYRLSGVKANEYTEATTSQLTDPATKDWNRELISRLGYPEHMFLPLSKPGTVLGGLRPELVEELGFDTQVVLPASHDTGSAVLAVPSNHPDTVYISSGTWSLMGVERMEADCSPASKSHNFTNEGGYNYRFRYLKNIMGLWMIQSVKKELKEERGLDLPFAQIAEDASKESIPSIVDCNDSRFLAPENMIREVKNACQESGQPVPQTHGEISSVIYNSLAKCYAGVIEEIEEITGKRYESISIVGGGSNAEYLNVLTAKYTGRTVLAGPTEATAIGNVLVQMLASGEVESLEAGRDCIFSSFAVKTFKP